MKIAVTYENGEIFQHFGHTEQFKIYEVEGKEIINEKIINTNGSGHGLLGKLLISEEVDFLICGGIGNGARNILEDNNIKVYPGVLGNADNAIKKFIEGTLEYDINKKCDHAGHDSEHNCTIHDCSKDKGGCSGNK